MISPHSSYVQYILAATNSPHTFIAQLIAAPSLCKDPIEPIPRSNEHALERDPHPFITLPPTCMNGVFPQKPGMAFIFTDQSANC